MNSGFIIMLLILLLDITVIWSIVRSKRTQGYKILYSLIVLLFPIIGVSIYYLIKK